jgi:putrescine transport system substrate-binding protein
MWGTTGIAYNVQKINAAMANAPVGSMAMLFDPGIVARFKPCGIVMLDSPTDVFPQVLAWLKLNPDSDGPEDLETAVAALLAVRPFIRKFHSSEYVNELATGDACLALGFSGDVAQAARRARQAKAGVEIAYRVPKEGAQIWIDAWAIPADAPHPGNAHRFLDFVLRPEIAGMNSNFIGYANANADSQPFVDAEILKDPGIYPDEATMARLFTVSPKPQSYERLRTRAWTRVTSGR